MKPAIVGEAPSMRTSRPFAGRSGERLAELSGLASLEALRDRFRLVNLLGHWPGPDASGKGSAFPMQEARSAAATLRLPSGSLLCGRRVAAAFGLAAAPYFAWCDVDGRRVAVIPHPSGVSRWWNDPENVARARAFLRAATA
jgi:uracil-DNA glycosylase